MQNRLETASEFSAIHMDVTDFNSFFITFRCYVCTEMLSKRGFSSANIAGNYNALRHALGASEDEAEEFQKEAVLRFAVRQLQPEWDGRSLARLPVNYPAVYLVLLAIPVLADLRGVGRRLASWGSSRTWHARRCRRRLRHLRLPRRPTPPCTRR